MSAALVSAMLECGLAGSRQLSLLDRRHGERSQTPNAKHQRRWRALHREEARARARAGMRALRARQPERQRQKWQDWKHAHRKTSQVRRRRKPRRRRGA